MPQDESKPTTPYVRTRGSILDHLDTLTPTELDEWERRMLLSRLDDTSRNIPARWETDQKDSKS